MSLDLTNTNHNQNFNVSQEEQSYNAKLLKMAHAWTIEKGLINIAQDTARFDANKLDSNVIAQKQKSFTGVSEATGSGLIQTRYEPLRVHSVKSGILIDANIDYKDNQDMDVQIDILKDSGDFVEFPNGTPPVGFNPVTEFAPTIKLRLKRYCAIIDGFKDILERNQDPNMIVTEMKSLLEMKKLQLVDQIAVSNVMTVGNGVVNINVTTPPTYAKLTIWMSEMISQIGDRDDKSGVSPVFTMNKTTYHNLLTEQNSQGDLINSILGSRGRFTAIAGKRESAGLVGYFDGFEVWVTNKVKSNYQGDADGTLVASGGAITNKSAIIFCLPQSNAVRRGKSVFDNIYDFSADNGNYLMWQNNARVLAAETYLVGSITDPAHAIYALV
jgi:hypothetical protein